MQLKEIVTEILEKKFAKSTQKMANALQLGEMDIRRAAGIEPGSRRNQEKTFQLTMKILPLCKELKIDPARSLPGSDASELIEGEIKHGSPAGSDDKKGTTRPKKKGAGTLPPRRTKDR